MSQKDQGVGESKLPIETTLTLMQLMKVPIVNLNNIPLPYPKENLDFLTDTELQKSRMRKALIYDSSKKFVDILSNILDEIEVDSDIFLDEPKLNDDEKEFDIEKAFERIEENARLIIATAQDFKRKRRLL